MEYGCRGFCRVPDTSAGETDSAVNLNWYAPTGTEKAIVKFGDRIVEASVEELHTPTKVDKNKYTDTGKMVCKATVDGLTKDTEYQYQVSYDDGKTWSEINSYKTAKENEFKFGFTSDPQIKENGESNKKDGTHLMVRTRPVGQLCWIS